MSITTRDKLAFALAMGRHTRADVRQVQELLRYAAALEKLADTDWGRAKRTRIVKKVCDICADLSGPGYVVPLFAGDPRNVSPRLKIRVPAGVEVEVPM